ncbi:MAG: hypothetical protein PHG30_02355 [Eubacteriales bacterium]|nr:hypothetical protein [Eubacteriales bacterium]
MYDGLPDACLTLMPSDGRLIYIERGVNGYHTSEWETGDPQKNRKIADFYNEKRGVTQAQEKAMLNGSLFGWDVPAADPNRYEATSSPEVNEGYEIIKRANVGEIEIVLGKSATAPDMYVTWRRTPAHEHHSRPEYYWGHYFGKEYLAVEDFDSRVKSETLDSKESKSVSKKRHEPER